MVDLTLLYSRVRIIFNLFRLPLAQQTHIIYIRSEGTPLNRSNEIFRRFKFVTVTQGSMHNQIIIVVFTWKCNRVPKRLLLYFQLYSYDRFILSIVLVILLKQYSKSSRYVEHQKRDVIVVRVDDDEAKLFGDMHNYQYATFILIYSNGIGNFEK